MNCGVVFCFLFFLQFNSIIIYYDGIITLFHKQFEEFSRCTQQFIYKVIQ